MTARAPIITHIRRAGQAESRHLTRAVLIGPGGAVVYAAGDAGDPLFIRSMAKPFQAAGLHESGAFERFGLTSADLAIACASHNGEPVHIAAVAAFMQRVGIDPGLLKCGIHRSFLPQVADDLAQAGKQPTALHNNCSGKHTAFLAMAKALGVSHHDYLDPAHPVQVMTREFIARFSGESDFVTGVDGCSAPTCYLPLEAIARMAWRFADPGEKLLAPQFAAMTEHPYLVGGEGSIDTDFMLAFAGRAVTKKGTEGGRLMAIRDRQGEPWGLVLKTEDGSARALGQVALTILHKHNLVTDQQLQQLNHYYRPQIESRAGVVVGDVVTTLPA